MNQSNSTIEMSSSSQPEISHGRVALYMKSVRGEMYPIDTNDTNTDYHKFVRLGGQK